MESIKEHTVLTDTKINTNGLWETQENGKDLIFVPQ